MALLPSGLAKTGVVPYQIYPKTISQSLRFEDGDGAHLVRTPTSNGSRTTFTWSSWIKRGNLGANLTQNPYIFGFGSSSGSAGGLRFDLDDQLKFLAHPSYRIATTQVFRDTSAWYHIVIAVDTTQASLDDAYKLWVNGEQITDFSEQGDITLVTPQINETSYPIAIGRIQYSGAASNYWDGYMAEIHFVDGTTYDADDFGELRSGIWVPKTPSVTYGTNGFHLALASNDLNTSGSAISDPYGSATDVPDDAFADASGSGNHFNINSLVVSDIVPDSPTSNWCTLNPLKSSTTLKEGNLKNNYASNAFRGATSTFAIDSGKWYWEVSASGIEGIYCNPEGPKSGSALTYPGDDSTTNRGIGVRGTGRIYVNNALSLLFSGYSGGDVIGFALDADNDTLKIYLDDGTLDHTVDISDPHGDASAAKDMTQYKPYFVGGGTVNGGSQILNFGQDDTFAGTKTSVGNSDENGIGSFKHPVPSGYLALCTANLPDPAIDPAQEATADQHFNVYTYTGNGASQLIGDVVREIPDAVSIDQSLRFDHAGNTYLTFDPESDGDLTEWTFSTWFKRTGVDARMIFGQGTNGSNNRDIIYLEATGELQVASYGGSYVFQFVTDRIFNDSAAWYHLVVAYDSSQATDTDRVKIWVNGLRITRFSTNTKPDLNDPCAHFNSGSPQYIGKYIDQGTYWNGYQAETHWIDGTAYAATDFGAYNADGIWTPITPSVTYGTNGWHIDYSAASYTDNGSDPDTFADQANSNDFSAYGIASEDIFPDTPTNSFCTADSNQNVVSNNTTLSEGNLKVTRPVSNWETIHMTSKVSSGKWYWEVYINSANQMLGVCDPYSDVGEVVSVYTRANLWNIQDNGDIYANGAAVDDTYRGTISFGNTDKLMLALDADSGKLWFGKNGDWYNSGDPAAGTGHIISGIVTTSGLISPSSTIFPATGYQFFNFGADATWSDTDTGSAGPYSDDNSVGEFYYQPPTGFLALAENNLIQFDDNPLESPDFVWIKGRDTTRRHLRFDSVRGVHNYLLEDTSAEGSDVTTLTGFHKNGFTIGDNQNANTSGEDFVAWVWKAGGTASTIAVGDIDGTNPTIATNVSANTTSGFSIIGYTGNGTDGATIAHGLDSPPELCIFKTRDDNVSWIVGGYPYGPSVFSANNQLCSLDLTAAVAAAGSNAFTVGTSYITLDDQGGALGLGPDDMICYCFHSVDGFSKVGSYTGNGSTDGPFVYTGFRPKMIIWKRTNVSGQSWEILDTERDPYNGVTHYLYPDTSGAENNATAYPQDFLSNGFKIRHTGASANASGSNYVYIAFAESPFKYSNAR